MRTRCTLKVMWYPLALFLCLLPVISACKSNGGNARATDAAAEEQAYEPCADQACGERCTLCAPGDANCEEPPGVKACDALGACEPAPVTCNGDKVAPEPAGAYAPCAGKACGEPCKVCPPGAPDCVETAVLKQCTIDGECLPGEAECVTPEEAPGQDVPDPAPPKRAPAL